MEVSLTSPHRGWDLKGNVEVNVFKISLEPLVAGIDETEGKYEYPFDSNGGSS